MTQASGTGAARRERQSLRGMGKTSESPLPVTQRGRNTRNSLISAAAEIFSHTGFSDVRITDITAHAGVASGTFYTYFDSKDEIFREIARDVLNEMASTPTRAPDNVDKDPVRDIEYATKQYFLCCARNARVARSIEELQFRDSGVGGARHATVLRGVRRISRWIEWLQRREIADPEIDAWHTAMALHAMNVSVAYDQFVHREEPGDIDSLTEAITQIWRRSLGLGLSPSPANK